MAFHWFRPGLKFLVIFLSIIRGASASVVIIDPGHGGIEGGAEKIVWSQGSKIHLIEKDLSLQISKLVAEYLKPKHVVYLTRSFDREVSLQERADLAEKTKADIFVSIHINASNDPRSVGYESYYLNQGHSKTVEKIEEKENKGLGADEVAINQILIDLIVSKMAPASRQLSKSIHAELNKVLPIKYKAKNRGIRPALFYVLALSKRPSTLLEVGFLSNPSEGLRLASKKFQQDYAKAVADGINHYLATIPQTP